MSTVQEIRETVCDATYLMPTGPVQIPLGQADGAWQLSFEAPAGLYQLSVIADAAEFDWEGLYYADNMHGNSGERTGPWDFDGRTKSHPLVPSYRITVDGKYIGLWFFQRVSIEDIEAKRFRGRMACWLAAAGKHTIKLAPYRPVKISWISATLETDPEDTLEPLPKGIKSAAAASPHVKWKDPAFWQEFKARLNGPLAEFRPGLEAAIEESLRQSWYPPGWMPLLLAGYLYTHKQEALDKAIQIIDEMVAKGALGNPDPEGYSHNGDFGAAYQFYMLSMALHAIPDELGPERIAKIKERLIHHGNIFVDLMLLNRDFWGGSLIQDHGWRSALFFAPAALNLYGVLPEAARWLTYILPRAERSLDAMPRDGFLPSGSYNAPWLHSDPIALYREMTLPLTGNDPYDRPEVRICAEAIWKETMTTGGEPLLPGPLVDAMPFFAGGQMYAGLAAKFRDGKAQWVARTSALTLLKESFHENMRFGYLENRIFLPLLYDPSVPADTNRPSKALLHFPDSGVVVRRDDVQGLLFSIQAGPWCGHFAYRHAPGPCDRMGMSPTPGDGHFILMLDGKMLLVSPDSGYKLRSAIRSCMLVDDQGQYGDIGYPMSLPSFEYRGQEIEYIRHTAAYPLGETRIKLAPSYPAPLGVLAYTRDFLFEEHRLTVRDRVVLASPRKLSWLFQTKEALGLVWKGRQATIAGQLRISPRTSVPLATSTQPSPVVFSYSSASKGAKFVHAKYDTVESVSQVTVDFVLEWDASKA